MSTLVETAPPPPASLPARVLSFLARWVEVYSQAAVGVARVGTAVAVALAILAVAGNVFTRNVLGYSLFGSDELARFAFLWAIWLGVSLAIKRGSVTVITFVADAGPDWWQRAVRHLRRGQPGHPAGLRLRALDRVRDGPVRQLRPSPSLHMPWFYPVVSMTVGVLLHHPALPVGGAGRRGPARPERHPGHPHGRPRPGRGRRDRGGGLGARRGPARGGGRTS